MQPEIGYISTPYTRDLPQQQRLCGVKFSSSSPPVELPLPVQALSFSRSKIIQMKMFSCMSYLFLFPNAFVVFCKEMPGQEELFGFDFLH